MARTLGGRGSAGQGGEALDMAGPCATTFARELTEPDAMPEDKQPQRDAYQLILQAIDTGVYRPGDRLVESELAERFGVSRTPIREALQRLETQSLLTRDGRSLIVSSLDHNQMAELYVVRCELEGLAARLAARHATEEEIRVLRKMVEDDRSSSATPPRSPARTGGSTGRCISPRTTASSSSSSTSSTGRWR
jgi:DNA-binding transcriptional regulator YhcF (GntR family)